VLGGGGGGGLAALGFGPRVASLGDDAREGEPGDQWFRNLGSTS
jgi:hypothetical protein